MIVYIMTKVLCLNILDYAYDDIKHQIQSCLLCFFQLIIMHYDAHLHSKWSIFYMDHLRPTLC